MSLRFIVKGVGVALVAGVMVAASTYSYFSQSPEEQQTVSAANFLFALGVVGGIGYAVHEVKKIATDVIAERNPIPWVHRVNRPVDENSWMDRVSSRESKGAEMA